MLDLGKHGFGARRVPINPERRLEALHNITGHMRLDNMLTLAEREDAPIGDTAVAVIREDIKAGWVCPHSQTAEAVRGHNPRKTLHERRDDLTNEGSSPGILL